MCEEQGDGDSATAGQSGGRRRQRGRRQEKKGEEKGLIPGDFTLLRQSALPRGHSPRHTRPSPVPAPPPLQSRCPLIRAEPAAVVVPTVLNVEGGGGEESTEDTSPARLSS